jgi:uncharacterized protein
VAHGQMQSVLPRIFLGILLGFAFYYSKSLWVSILAHFINNALSIVLSFAYTQKYIATDIANATDINVVYGVISGAICVGLMYMMHQSKASPTWAPNEASSVEIE